MKYLAVFLIIVASACNNADKLSDANTHSSDTLTYGYDTVRLESSMVPKDTSFADRAYASIVFASFTDGKINKAIESRVISDMDPDRQVTGYHNIVKDFVASYEKEAKEETGSGVPWSMDREQKVLFNSPILISIQETYFWFTGGAHPNTVYLSYNLNPKTLSFLTIDSLIKPDKMGDFNVLAERIFRNDEKLTPDQSLAENYFFEDDKFKLTQTFNIIPSGLVFRYSPYEIKPYAAGDTELKIPIDQMQDMIRDEYKVLFSKGSKL